MLLGVVTSVSSTPAEALDALGRLQDWLLDEHQHLSDQVAGTGPGVSSYQATARLVEKLNRSLAETEADQATTST